MALWNCGCGWHGATASTCGLYLIAGTNWSAWSFQVEAMIQNAIRLQGKI
jgi:hypothetical protein